MTQSNQLTPQQVEDIQNLYALHIPRTVIARHFNVTSPAIAYYTKGLPKHSISYLVKITKTIKDVENTLVTVTQAVEASAVALMKAESPINSTQTVNGRIGQDVILHPYETS